MRFLLLLLVDVVFFRRHELRPSECCIIFILPFCGIFAEVGCSPCLLLPCLSSIKRSTFSCAYLARMMPFIYKRTVRFRDTDAAGVVYFANVLAMCHEACEESLAASGINLKAFFSNPEVVIPVVHASVDFLRPMFCGDHLLIHLMTTLHSCNEFEITYEVLAAEANKIVAKANTRHVCINPSSRARKELPAEIIRWLQQWEV